MVVVLAVVTLGGPLLVLARHQVFTSANERLQQQAASVAADLEDRLTSGRPVDLSQLRGLPPGERIVVTSPDGEQTATGATLSGAVRQRSVVIAHSTVAVQVDAGPTDAKARNATVLVVGLALLAGLVAVALAIRQARHLSAPLAGLAGHADALGLGDFTPSSQVSGIAEIDVIARVLDRSARQIDTLMTLQRELATDAAHQLRTPLTGIGLRLEEIARIGDAETAAEADLALSQVERLNHVITTLMARARGDEQEPTDIDLVALVLAETQVWKRVLGQHHRHVVVETTPGIVARARENHVIGILTSLLDNALTHGDGEVRVCVGADNNDATLTVRDAGSGIPADLLPHVFQRSVSGSKGTGIGLALARSLALEEGGTLEVASASPAELTLRLPLLRTTPQ
jgi:signal transduction histidine kinase